MVWRTLLSLVVGVSFACGPNQGAGPAAPSVEKKRVEHPAPPVSPREEETDPNPSHTDASNEAARISLIPTETDPGSTGSVPPDPEALRPLVRPGDLPAELSGGLIGESAPAIFRDIPKSDVQVFQQIVSGDRRMGGVGVFLYRQPATRDSAYRVLAKGIGSIGKRPNLEVWEAPVGLGRKGLIGVVIPASPAVKVSSTLLFTRCAAVVHIVLGNDPDASAAVAFAKRLDQRLAATVCRTKVDSQPGLPKSKPPTSTSQAAEHG